MRWAGHHIGVTTEALGTQRLPVHKLMPGWFRGGVDVGLVLLDVRPVHVRFKGLIDDRRWRNSQTLVGFVSDKRPSRSCKMRG
jgi:hypothetical protein